MLVPLVVLSLLSSCVTYRLQPLASPAQDKAALSVKASADWGSEIEFNVKVTNRSDKTLTVDSDKFRLYVGDLKDWKELPLTSSDEYYNTVETEARSRPVITVTQTEPPVYRRRVTTTTTTIGGSGNSVTIIRNEPRVVVVEPAETRVVTIVPGPNEKRLAWLKDHLFYSVDLEPGKDYEGLVYGSSAKGTHYKLVLPVDGKDYEVVFERVKEKGPFMNLD